MKIAPTNLLHLNRIPNFGKKYNKNNFKDMDEKENKLFREMGHFYYDIALVYSDVAIEVPIIGKIGGVYIVINPFPVYMTQVKLDSCEQLGFKANQSGQFNIDFFPTNFWFQIFSKKSKSLNALN